MAVNVTIIIVVVLLIVLVATFFLASKKENYKMTTIIPNAVSYPTFPATLDPRFDMTANSGIVKYATTDDAMRAVPSESAVYTTEEMIKLGGCAVAKLIPEDATGGYYSSTNAALNSALKFRSKDDKNAIASANAQFGRGVSYNASVKAENMLPATEITAAVDPTQNFIYLRSLNQQMKRLPLGQQDFLRGDLIPRNPFGSTVNPVKINQGEGNYNWFQSRYGNTNQYLTKGYFQNFNDVEQAVTRDEAVFQSRAQYNRDMALNQTVQDQSQSGNFTRIEDIL